MNKNLKKNLNKINRKEINNNDRNNRIRCKARSQIFAPDRS